MGITATEIKERRRDAVPRRFLTLVKGFMPGDPAQAHRASASGFSLLAFFPLLSLTPFFFPFLSPARAKESAARDA